MRATAFLLTLGFIFATRTVMSAQHYSSDELKRRAVERRAVEAVIWGIPAVNFDRMVQAMMGAKGDWNQVLYWSRPSTWKNQTLTPNPDAIYAMPFFDTKKVGAMVLEIPPAEGGGSIVGSIMDCWQIALEDVGPAGVDKGKGGKYLILPPGYKDKTPAGYIVLSSANYEGYALLRSSLKSNSVADIAAAATYMKRVRLYPLSAAAHPPETVFVSVDDVLLDATIPYDQRFFEALNRVVQYEPWLERDRVMIDQLKSIGIEQGKPFSPDSATAQQLKAAIDEAHAWLVAQYETAYPAYSFATHALIRDVRWASRSSLTQVLQTNSDGTVDIYFGPKAPAGKESNWVPTKSGERFEALFRFYGPEKPVFDKSWTLPDIEKAR